MIDKKKIKKKDEIFYKTNKVYSITINIDDRYQGSMQKTAFSKLAYCKNLIYDVFKTYNNIRILLHADISEPREMINNKPRIHFHGCILFIDNESISNYLLMVLPKLISFCYINIDTITDMSIWQDYCTKYDHITNITPIRKGLSWGAGLMSSPDAKHREGESLACHSLSDS